MSCVNYIIERKGSLIPWGATAEKVSNAVQNELDTNGENLHIIGFGQA